MDTLEAIRTRRSVRSYRPDRVSRETLQVLLDAAAQAPSAMGRRPWSFAVVDGPERLRSWEPAILELWLGDDAGNPGLASTYPADVASTLRTMLAGEFRSIFHGAPALIVVFASSSDELARGDCHLAAENLMIAATALGLGTCVAGFARPFLVQADVKAQLGAPDTAEVALAIVVGVPADHDSPPERPAPNVHWS